MALRSGLIFIVFFILTACVEDPPVPVTGEAVLRSRFIPLDSVSKLEVSQQENADLILQINETLAELDSLEEAGETGDFENERAVLNNELDSLEESGSSLSSIISRLRRGDIQLDFLAADETTNQIQYLMPQSIYGLPLYGRLLEATYRIGYGSYRQQATISYQTENLFENRVAKQRGFSLRLLATDFDSVRIDCPQDTCNTDEILYTFYF